MENKFPKNVRQIGNVSDTPKIYVEDYVDTFLNQICDKADKEQAGAFLVGKKEVTEGLICSAAGSEAYLSLSLSPTSGI